jgi:hypothetical protein
MLDWRRGVAQQRGRRAKLRHTVLQLHPQPYAHYECAQPAMSLAAAYQTGLQVTSPGLMFTPDMTQHVMILELICTSDMST